MGRNCENMVRGLIGFSIQKMVLFDFIFLPTMQVEGDSTDALTQGQGNTDAMLQDETAVASNDAASDLTANDFYVLLETASLLDEEAAASLAAVARDGVRLVGGVTVNQVQLDALQSASAAGAYPLTFYAGEDYVAVTVTVYGAVNAEATSTQTGGNITVKINEYDEIQGWINGDVKDVEITVDFDDITSADKSVSVTLPEGLKYMKYPVAATDSDNSSALQLVDNMIFKEFVTGIESYPKKPNHGYDYGSFNGTLAYTFRESTEKITFTIKVAVDESVYYGPKTFQGDEGIVVEASKAGGSGEPVSIGKVVQEINATHGTTTTGLLLWSNAFPRTMVKDDASSFYLSRMYAEYRGASSTAAVKKYFQDIEFTYYYLPELTYSHFTWSGNTYGTAPSVENHPDGDASDSTPYFVMKAENVLTGTSLNSGFWFFHFNIKSGTAAGTYENTYAQRIAYTAYDGTKINAEYTANSGQRITRSVKESLVLVDDKTTSLVLNTTDRTYAAGVSVDYQISVPIYIESDETDAKENQWFEVSIDPNFQATQVLIPVDSTELKTNARLYYETSSDVSGSGRWITDDTAKLYRYSDGFVRVTKNSLGLASNEYITFVRAYVGAYEAGYQPNATTGMAYAGPNAVGNIIGTAVANATITMRTYACDPAVSDRGALYIPVPKAGNNFGSAFQDAAFTWNMALMAAPTIFEPFPLQIPRISQVNSS